MAQLIIRHKVKDYPKWKSMFDENGAKRKAAGSQGGRLFRSEKDRNEVVILYEGQLVVKSSRWNLQPTFPPFPC